LRDLIDFRYYGAETLALEYQRASAARHPPARD
jgi:hypothetical protein